MAETVTGLLDRALTPIRERLAGLESKVRTKASVHSATITSTNPLRFQLDGEDAPKSITPDTLVPVAAGDRVRMLHHGRTSYTVIGTIGAIPQSGWRDVPGIISPGDQTDAFNVTFPRHYRTAPTVIISPAGSTRILFRVYNITNTGFTARGRNVSTVSTSDGSFYWIALPAS